jgi:hypothetical protein
MAQPVWITPPGSLGTIPEGVFYQIPLQAYEPASAETVLYRVIAGELPAGIQCEANGLIAGVPKAIASVQGVPQEVNRDVVSKFAVRAYTIKTVNGQTLIDRLSDRTFTLTVTGPDAPEFVTPAGNLASYYDGTVLTGLQIEYVDPDPNETVIVRLVGGRLPPGTTLSSTGLISGFIGPNPEVDAIAGFSRDDQGYDEFNFDFQTRVADVTYEFTLEVTDGTQSNLRTFNIIVYSRNNLSADNTTITADNTFVTADETNQRTPILLTPAGLIDTVRSDNFFAFQFQALDLDGSQVAFVLTELDSTPLPGLTLDPGTGWLYGYIPNLGLTELVFYFQVQVYKVSDPSYISAPLNYSLAINGPVDSDIRWLTDSNLGTIVNGATSTLYVRAVSRAGLSLQYRLLSGSDSSLPQGLQLLPSGNIAGRCSFDTFAVDSGTTTFDIDSKNRTPRPTTFDLKFTFTVQVYSLNSVVNFIKVFSITVVREYNEPYQNLYVQAMPPVDDRFVLETLLQDPQIFPPDLIYRGDDPNFGVARRVIYQHAFGLTATTLADYYSSLYLNHYWKNLVLGEIAVAEARDATGQVIYEVVYSNVKDNLLNSDGQSVSKQVTLAYPIELDDSSQVSVVYPNSLINMRDQVIDTVGQVGNILPTWMTSKQANGRVLGFTPAWVIAYVKPGQGQRIAYNIRTRYGDQLNLIDFEVDRYELDSLLTKNWDPETITLSVTSMSGNGTTVTVNYATQAIPPGVAGQYLVISNANPSLYNGRYTILTCTTNQITFTSTNTSAYVSGATLTIPAQWMPPPNATTFDLTDSIVQPWLNNVGAVVNWQNNLGANVVWFNIFDSGVRTIFDGGSMQFIEPVDMYSNSTEYDKYLVFPKTNILGQ